MEPKPTGVSPCPSIQSSAASSSMFSVGGGGCDFPRVQLDELLGLAPVNNEDVKLGELLCQGIDDLLAAWEAGTEFSTCEELEDNIMGAQNIAPKWSTNIPTTTESQSSICGNVGSPVSANKPNPRDNQAKGASSGSSHEQSDEDDEPGACEQSIDPIAKRDRRKESNRKSAMRSRRRKQAQLADLESQVEQLKEQNATLYKQLTDANQQFHEAHTNNRVLRSDVDALRAKVNLAEDIVARGSLTSLNNQLLQTQISHHLNPPPQLNTTSSLGRMAHVSPTITVHANDASYAATTTNNNNFNPGGLISDAISCVTDDFYI